jgi:hypothetical protein
MPDPEALIVGFHAEFESLQRSVQESTLGRGEPAAPSHSIEVMSALLDEALAKVDALLEDRAGEPSQGVDRP